MGHIVWAISEAGGAQRGTIEITCGMCGPLPRGSAAPADKEAAALWRAAVLDQGCTPATVNSKLAAINKFFSFAGWAEFRVKPLKIQRRLFRDDSRELTRAEYLRLLETARALGRERLALLMETICATGIRVSEVQNITVEAARRGKTEIAHERQDPHHSAAGKTLSEAPKIRAKTTNCFW